MQKKWIGLLGIGIGTVILLSACVPEQKIEPVPQAPKLAVLSASDAIAMQSPQTLGYQVFNPQKNPDKRSIRYFDKWYRPEVRATKNGFYREIIGKTPDGRAVVQDFYQNNDTPYTTPYIAIKDAKLRLFDNKSAIDSRVGWFHADGTLNFIADYQNGKPQGEWWLFQNQKMVAHIIDKIEKKDDDMVQMRFFYPNGSLMAERITRQENSKIFFYYEHGSAMLQIEDTPKQSTRIAWDAQGKTVAPQDIQAELNRVQGEISRHLKKIHKESDLLNKIIQ